MSPLDVISICVLMGIFLFFPLYIALSVSHTIACAVVGIGHWLTPMTIFSSFVPAVKVGMMHLLSMVSLVGIRNTDWILMWVRLIAITM